MRYQLRTEDLPRSDDPLIIANSEKVVTFIIPLECEGTLELRMSRVGLYNLAGLVESAMTKLQDDDERKAGER